MAHTVTSGRWLSLALLFLAQGCTTSGTSTNTAVSQPASEQLVDPSGGEIVRARCLRCHHQGGTIFSLETAADVAEHREAMGHVISEGFMPAWLPSDECVALAGARRLARKERDVLLRALMSGEEFNVQGPPWEQTHVFESQSTLTAQVEFSPQAEVRCFALGGGVLPTSISAMKLRPTSVPGLEFADVFALPMSRLPPRGNERLWDCSKAVSGKYVGTLSRAAPVLRFPQGTALEIPPDSSLVIRVVASRDTKDRDIPAIKPELALQTPAAGDSYSRVRYEHIEAAANAAAVFPLAATMALRGLIPTGDSAIEAIKLQYGDKCAVDIPQWERQFSELYRFSAPRGLPLRENELLQVSCRRRESARPTPAHCGFWLLLE